MKSVVIGGAGFVGSSLVKVLFESGHDVSVIDNMSRGAHYMKGVTTYVRDATVPGVMDGILSGADVVYNLAAHVAGVIYNANNHAEMYSRNMALAMEPALACARVAVGRYVYVSSVCVYDKPDGATEDTKLSGEPVAANNGYSWAKRMGERMCAWAMADGNYVIVRPTNMYGPRDYFDDRSHVIPAVIKKVYTDETGTVTLHGTGREVRQFLYVEDAAFGLMAVASRGKSGNVYNMSLPNAGISILDLANAISSSIGVSKEIRFSGGDGGDERRFILSDKIANDTGWFATTSIYDGIENTIAWAEMAGVLRGK